MTNVWWPKATCCLFWPGTGPTRPPDKTRQVRQIRPDKTTRRDETLAFASHTRGSVSQSSSVSSGPVVVVVVVPQASSHKTRPPQNSACAVVGWLVMAGWLWLVGYGWLVMAGWLVSWMDGWMDGWLIANWMDRGREPLKGQEPADRVTE